MLHVTNGDAAAERIRAAGVAGTILPWRDVLHEGPVPAGLPLEQLSAVRAEFLASTGAGAVDVLRRGFAERDRTLIESAHEDEVVLWFEHDLYDQLQLLDVLALVQPAAVPHETLELVQVGSFPGRPGFRGLGELSSRELVTLWPSRVRVTRSLIGDASAVWDDVRAPEPAALAARASASVAGLPFLPAALARLLEELPGPRDGLSRTERQLLHVLADGPRTPAAAFVATQELEDAPFHGDSWVFRALWELGRGDIRLVETASGERVPEPTGRADGLVESVSFVEQVELVLTPAGRQVLAGEADRVELLGIDRWVGGTHVCPGALWRWDSDRRELLPPA
jgi:hypothetical protein